ncbi:LGFP repeat-containing protein [Antrihabitans sp. YC2-6]|uniref:LGFP repeat-containing protein n=1 Tax=Antrihabitans sp. YC2-6 TaxID=2799498 RepID=UPI0018F57B4E|nr:esterase [Antrihabitans sp. YC2-6]MBJ8343760.1 esterase [Antrihabitans sp. YC2-6]
MGKIRRGTAGFVVAIAAVTLVGAGCSDDDKDKAKDAVGAATSQMGNATDAMKSSIASATASAGAEESGAEGSGAPSAGAGSSTAVAGADGTEYTIEGELFAKYEAVGGASSPLGKPQGNTESAPGGGKYQEFDGGIIYFNEATGANVVWGDIRVAWEGAGGPEGSLGYPTSDEKDIPGGKQSDFQNGYITWLDGQTEIHNN